MVDLILPPLTFFVSSLRSPPSGQKAQPKTLTEAIRTTRKIDNENLHFSLADIIQVCNLTTKPMRQNVNPKKS
jgi:hypothetical protein